MKLDRLLAAGVINAVVIDIKEYQGEVYIPGIKAAKEAGAYVPAITNLADWLAGLKKRGIYTIARQSAFKDNKMPRIKPRWGVHNRLGELWYDNRHTTWLDPYNKEAWTYNLLIALQAAKLGFDEVQFDYIRFPTDGNLKMIRYDHSSYQGAAANPDQALVDFLRQARRLLQPMGAKLSVDVFGLTATSRTGMGIGQVLGPMAEQVDYICPMVYPSHYSAGEYGLAHPNKEPYKTVRNSLSDAVALLGPIAATKIRPYLQDFSLGVRYGAREVSAQIKAAEDVGMRSWTLWNPRCVYSQEIVVPSQNPAVNPSHTNL